MAYNVQAWIRGIRERNLQFLFKLEVWIFGCLAIWNSKRYSGLQIPLKTGGKQSLEHKKCF